MRVRRVRAAAALIVVVIAAIWLWGQGGSRVVTVTTSPDRSERVELRSADRWHGWWAGGLDMPGYARLIRVADSHWISDSTTFELDGVGGVFWTPARDVQVGSTARFDRQAQRWRVSPGG